MQAEDSEIALKDVVGFLKNNRRQIALGGLCGLLLSVTYLVFTPKTFEARLQVQMAEFVHSNSGNSNSNSSIEEPAALIQRLRMPTTFSEEVQDTCDMPDNGEFGDYLGGKLKVVAVKNVANTVEMTVNASSPDHAKKCAEAIMTMVVEQQRKQIEDRLIGSQEQVLEYQRALHDEEQQLEKIKKSEIGNFGYLAKLDKLSWLRARIDALHEETLLAQMHPAKLVAPIYAPSEAVSPKKSLVLLLGMVLGLLLGLLYIFGRQVWRRMD